MVKRRPETIVFDWKETGSYSATTGRRVEGSTNRTVSIPARIEVKSANESIVESGRKIDVSVKIFADLVDLTGITIPSNAFITYRGERREVIKVEQLQTHIVIWV
jgi:hypothetical protein